MYKTEKDIPQPFQLREGISSCNKCTDKVKENSNI